MMEFTDEAKINLETYLKTHELPSGLGTEKSPCSIAAINLAISGKLTDKIPDCMSRQLGRATIRLQDAMPAEMRNSNRYKSLLPHMAGTGRLLEKERSAVLIEWMWEVVLPQLQDVADKGGYGDEWRKMCGDRTHSAANAAALAAANASAFSAANAALTALASALAVSNATAADAAVCAAAASSDASFWDKVDPIGVLGRATFLNGRQND